MMCWFVRVLVRARACVCARVQEAAVLKRDRTTESALTPVMKVERAMNGAAFSEMEMETEYAFN